MKKLYIIFALLIASLNLYAKEEAVVASQNNIIESSRDLRITTQFGYTYYSMPGDTNYKEYKPNIFVDITYLINKSFEIGFGFGVDSLTLAKLGENIPNFYEGSSNANDIVVPIYMVLKYNINLNETHKLVLSGKIGSIASNYYEYNYFNTTSQEFSKIALSSNTFLGASVGWGVKQWLLSVDYIGYIIDEGYSTATPVNLGGANPYYYVTSSFSQKFANKIGISLSYRFDFPLTKHNLQNKNSN